MSEATFASCMFGTQSAASLADRLFGERTRIPADSRTGIPILKPSHSDVVEPLQTLPMVGVSAGEDLKVRRRNGPVDLLGVIEGGKRIFASCGDQGRNIDISEPRQRVMANAGSTLGGE